MIIIIKTIISALLITLINEVSKRNLLFAAVIASLPIISVMALCWTYWENRNLNQISQLSIDIFYMVLPSLFFFISLPIFIKLKLSFINSTALASLVTIVAYGLMILILKAINIQL